MSDSIAAAFEAATSEATEGLEGAAETAPVEHPTETPTPAVPETTEVPRHTVKVRGQELEVGLDELINGYQRQSDYTQSKQELAAEREQLQSANELWTALHEDPAAVLEAIQEHFADVLSGEPPDPRDERLNSIESFVESQQQAALEAQVNAQISSLQSEFGEFDGDTLLEYAIENKIPNLRAAYLDRQYAADAAKRESERAAAKRSAPPVEGGSRAAAATEPPPREIGSLQDAVEAAMAEHGATSLNF